MLGEEKHQPPAGSAARRLCDLIDADPGVTVTALGTTEMLDGGMQYTLLVEFADGSELEALVS